MMNKKGDVPTILLFLVALFLSGMSLFIFVGFSGEFSDNSAELSKMIAQLEFGRQYLISESNSMALEAIGSADLEGEFKRLARERPFRVESAGNFLRQVEDGKFSFKEVEGGKFELKIEEIVILAREGQNSIRREFNLTMEFDSNGDLIELDA